MITIHRTTVTCTTGPNQTPNTAILEVRSDDPASMFLIVANNESIRFNRADLAASFAEFENREPCPPPETAQADGPFKAGEPVLVGDDVPGKLVIPSEESTIL